MSTSAPVLVVGEIFVDFTLPRCGEACKLRLGGIVHAARGLWACDVPYALAAICPAYLVGQAEAFALQHGCVDFVWLGNVVGSPNVIAIGDATEVSSQGYEDLLRDARRVELHDKMTELAHYSEVLIFPGHFNLGVIRRQFGLAVRFSFDIAYNVEDISALDLYRGSVRGVMISTSSAFFERNGSVDLSLLVNQVRGTDAEWFLLKENRGGSRLFSLSSSQVERIPAQLSRTVNSVGVGDVYAGVMIGLIHRGPAEAAWRGASAATYYAKTTYPDDFKRDVQRDLLLPLTTLRQLWGTFLPWHERPLRSVYLAAPDFSYIDKREVDQAIRSLEYHNFKVRRPVQENGELATDSDFAARLEIYGRDVELLKSCDAVFAVPIGRDPGTLVEIGLALSLGKPVLTFDPRGENNNTMVVAGSKVYSRDLDECLNGLFQSLCIPLA